MKRPRFTIAEIALFVLVVALGLAAIRSGSTAWTGAIVSVTHFALFSSLLGVAFGRGGRRVYWAGFALLGWGYLSLFYLPWQGASVEDGRSLHPAGSWHGSITEHRRWSDAFVLSRCSEMFAISSIRLDPESAHDVHVRASFLKRPHAVAADF